MTSDTKTKDKNHWVNYEIETRTVRLALLYGEKSADLTILVSFA